ncbi:PREDICTED: uncharacterized protein KIAA0895-like [Condylura cristata]|uniref:uncharacterized protein KIAA0895-like n=1 Tax=Condylura cristata TaxID=143302 RepID=UPI000643164F|nr:PREDICTED: uncharacterized protein KIAA0895-like [Condylura cristata]
MDRVLVKLQRSYADKRLWGIICQNAFNPRVCVAESNLPPLPLLRSPGWRLGATPQALARPSPPAPAEPFARGLGGTMLESIRVTGECEEGLAPVLVAAANVPSAGRSRRMGEKLHWPEQELAKKSVLNVEESLITDNKRSISHLPPGILKDIFTTGTSSYNVLLQSKEEKKHLSQKQSSSTYSKRCRNPNKTPSSSHSKDPRKIKAPMPVMSSASWYCLERQSAVFVTSSVLSPAKFTHDISVTGNSIVIPPKPKSKVKQRHLSTLQKPKPQPQLSRSFEKGDDFSGKKFCILTAIKPTNLEKEKLRFFKSDYTYNPQFEYANPSLPSVLAKHSNASNRFLKQVK